MLIRFKNFNICYSLLTVRLYIYIYIRLSLGILFGYYIHTCKRIVAHMRNWFIVESIVHLEELSRDER